MKLALFDLDHTLIPLDSDFSWGDFTTRLGWTDAGEFKRRNDAFYEDYKAGTLDIRAYVRFATLALRERGAQAGLEAREEFMRDVIAPGITPQALDLVRAHQAAGDAVVIVTATNDFVTRPIADLFGVSELLAVQLERVPHERGQPWYSGEIEGTPTFREGKVTRMEQWLSARGLGWGDVDATFYTDSINDLSLLEKVQHPVATNPDARLRAIAEQRGWRILELFKA